MKNVTRTLYLTIFPFALVILAYLAFRRIGTLTEPQLELLRLAPYPVFVTGFVISWKFNRSRELFMLLIMALGLGALQFDERLSTAAAGLSQERVYLLLSLLIPLNVLVFSFFKERGILSLWGLIRIAFIAAQAAFCVWVVRPEQSAVLALLYKELLPLELQKLTPLTQPALVLFAAAWTVLVIRRVRHRSSQELSFAAALLGIFYTLQFPYQSELYALFWTASALVLLISIIQDSYAMAFTDELTGLPSRRALRQELLKLGMNYSIAMLDIDHFKKFNDTHGHDTGDDVLRLVAQTLTEVTGGGRAFRYGGEEFTIVFPGKSLSDTLPHLEELREKVSKRGFTARSKKAGSKGRGRKSGGSRSGKTLYVTISIGVAQKSDKSKTPDAVMKTADTALYRAKKKGRNCVSK